MTLRPCLVFWASHRGIRPRPDQVLRLLSGSRYFGATLPNLRRELRFLPETSTAA